MSSGPPPPPMSSGPPPPPMSSGPPPPPIVGGGPQPPSLAGFASSKAPRKKKISVTRRPVDWSKCNSANRYLNGLLVTLQDREDVFISRVSASSASIALGSLLANRVGVRTPKYYLLTVGDQAYTEFCDSMKRVGADWPIDCDGCVMVMDLVSKAYTLSEIHRDERGDDSYAKLVFESPENVQAMAKIVALDLLLGRFRSPILRDTDSCVDSIYFAYLRAGHCQVNSVAHFYCPCDHESSDYSQYMADLDQLLTELSTSVSDQTCVSRLSTFYESLTGITIDVSLLRESLLHSLVSITEITCDSIIEELGPSSLNRLDLSLFKEAVARISAVGPTLYNILQAILDEKLFAKYNLSGKKAFQTGGHNPYSIKVTCMQTGGGTMSIECKRIRKFLTDEIESGEQQTDIMLFYELFKPEPYHTSASQPISEHPHVKEYCVIAKEFNVYLAMGTGMECEEDTRKMYCTCVLVGPDGFVGSYRKRRPVGSLTRGDSVGVFDTPIGRLAIMICFDIENGDIFDETTNLKPDILLNPVYIPLARNNQGKRAWNLGMDTMAHLFEAKARNLGMSIVRTDTPVGLASSQVISPYHTVRCPTNSSCIFSTIIPKSRVSEDVELDIAVSPFNDVSFGFESICAPPDYQRTAMKDNTGSRYLVHTLTTTKPVRAVCPFAYNDHDYVAYGVGRAIHVVHQSTMDETATLRQAHTNDISCLRYQADGVLFAADITGMLKVWDVCQATPSNRWSLASQLDPIRFANFTSPNTLITASSGSFVWLDSRCNDVVRTFSSSSPITAFAKFQDNQCIVGDANGTVYKLDNRCDMSIEVLATCNTSISGVARLREEGISFVSEGGELGYVNKHGEISKYQPLNGFASKFTSLTGLVNAPEGDKYVVVGCDTGKCYLFDSSIQEKPLHRFAVHDYPVTVLDSCDRSWVSSSTDGFLCMWVMSSNRLSRPWSKAFV